MAIRMNSRFWMSAKLRVAFLLENRVPCKGRGGAEFQTPVVKNLLATPKSDSKERVEAMAAHS